MKILVGLSGGVDSSVALLLLRNEGHDVAGATMSLWREGRYRGGDRDACFGPGEKEDIEYVRRLCRREGIPHYLFDCSEEYERTVLGDFRREYLSGRTPNPCVRCNARMKFGLLPGLARSAGAEFDLFATGHYARIDRSAGRPRLMRALDRRKDQSYFLYRLTPEQLERCCFPLGGMTKPEVRRLAGEFHLSVCRKPDSQDFYSGSIAELLDVPPRPGAIVDESGNRLGTHSGYWNYTVGQRRGLGIASGSPLYVVAIRACSNEVVVSRSCRCVSLTVSDLSWISVPAPDGPFEAEVKVRSAQEPVPCRASALRDGVLSVDIPEGIVAAAPGQSAVFYRGDVVLGGGIITGAEP